MAEEPNQPEELEEPIVLASAHRHGVTEDDMLHAWRFAIGHVRQDGDDMAMFMGPDTTGTLIEVGVVIWWEASLPSPTPCAQPNQIPEVVTHATLPV